MLNITEYIAEGADPITAVINRDWAAFGGWSLFVSLCILIVISFMRGWIVPGGMYNKMEDAATTMAKANAALIDQNGQLITSNEITKHFFQATVPVRGEARK